jgi:hypothetical protein
MTQDLVYQSRKNLVYLWRTNGQELSKSNISIPIAPWCSLHSTVNDALKFLSANIGLIKTKLDDTIKESHLIDIPPANCYLLIYKYPIRTTTSGCMLV